MSTRIFLLSLFLAPIFAFGQEVEKSARNGWWLPNSDTLRLFIVFAELTDDPKDAPQNSAYPVNDHWLPGQLPKDPGKYLDQTLDDPEDISGEITKYFHQASLGNYIVLGDYYPKLIQVPYGTGSTFKGVVDALNSEPGEYLTTATGLKVGEGYNDFDSWTYKKGEGLPSVREPDGLLDVILVVWRVNSKVNPPLDITNSGYFASTASYNPIKGMRGFAAFSEFESHGNDATGIMRHEFTHGLLGGNNFHQAGGAGTRKTLPIPSQYGILSSWSSMANTWTGWDRHRLGWKAENKQFYISAVNSEGQEVAADLRYQQPARNAEFQFWLRDFVSTGDAIRIKLPYLNALDSMVENQYLWLENRQNLEDIQDLGNLPAGIYAYLQIGKDDMSSFREQSNYLYNLQRLGNYDIDYYMDENTININRAKANPLSGWNSGVQPLVNKDTSGNSKQGLMGDETAVVGKMYINNIPVPHDSFNYLGYPLLGSVFSVFYAGDRIALADNPAPTPILTWMTPERGQPRMQPQRYDNRTIPLNGIYIEFAESRPNPNGLGEDVKVIIRWDNNMVDKNVRWAGPVTQWEDIFVFPGRTVILDWSQTPHRPVNPVVVDGRLYFSDPTVYEIRSGATLTLGAGANLVLRQQSKLILNEGSVLHVNSGAKVVIGKGSSIVLNGGSIQMEDGAIIRNSGEILVETEGAIEGEGTVFTTSVRGFPQRSSQVQVLPLLH